MAVTFREIEGFQVKSFINVGQAKLHKFTTRVPTQVMRLESPALCYFLPLRDRRRKHKPTGQALTDDWALQKRAYDCHHQGAGSAPGAQVWVSSVLRGRGPLAQTNKSDVVPTMRRAGSSPLVALGEIEFCSPCSHSKCCL